MFEDTNIFIPTKGRLNNQELLDKTVIQLKFPLYPESKAFIFDNPPKYEQLQFPFMKDFV